MLAAAAAGGDPALWWLSWSALYVAHAARLLLAPAWLRWGAYTPARDAVVDALFMVALPLLAGAAPVLLAAAPSGRQPYGHRLWYEDDAALVWERARRGEQQ